MVDTSKNLVGKKVKIVKNTANHNQPIGSIATVTSVGGGVVRLKELPSWTFYPADLELTPVTREEIEKEISELQAKIKEEQEKLKFMDDNKVEEFDETQFKVFQTLATLDNKELSALEKSKLIASLING
jgi:hypothetical protein